MKKILTLVFLFTIILTGCTSQTDGAIEQKTTDELNALVEWQPVNQNDTYWDKKITEATGQEVHYSSLPADSAAALIKLQLELSSGGDYQMVKLYPDQFASLANEDALTDLRPYLESDGQNILKAIPKEYWDAVTDPVTGAIYAIPYVGVSNTANGAILVRTDILAKEGLGVPTTTQELESTVCTLAQRGYRSPYVKTTQSAFNDITLKNAFGISYDFSEIDGQLIHTINNPNLEAYLGYQKAIYDCGGFGNDFTTITTQEAQRRFVNGDAVFMPVNEWQMNSIAADLAEVGIDFATQTTLITTLSGQGVTPQIEATNATIQSLLVVPKKQEAYATQVIQFIDKQISNQELQELIAFNGSQYTTDNQSGTFYVNSDGTYSQMIINDDGSVTYLNQPASADFTGTLYPWDVSIQQQSINAKSDVATSKAKTGFTEVTDAHSYYIYSCQEDIKNYGVSDPLAMHLLLPKYSQIVFPLTSELKDFGTVYMLGINKETFSAFNTRINSQYQIEEVTKEVNAVK